ncbi:MAG: PAS domain S-box protein [Gallionellaceae bacterium]|nr:PAS domain S-box protein [Gallionellaceae bacterium]
MSLATATPTRILIVEDDPDAAQLLEGLLRAAHHQIIGIAGNGREALRLAASTRPDLVIMDIVLQGDLDGIETAAILAERQDVPVLYLTAHSDDALYARARATSPLAYLHKPFEERELQRAIDVALDRHALLRRLKTSEAHLAEAQAVAHIGSWHWHLKEDRVEVSDELLRLLGLVPGGFDPGFDTFLHIAREADRPVMLQAVETLLGGGDPGDVDIRLDRPGVAARVLRLRGSVRRDASGQPHELLGTARDITAEWLARSEADAYREQLETRVAQRTAELSASNAELQAEIENRLRMEEALWRNEQRYRGLVDNLPEPILVMQDDQVVFANPALARLLGLPAATAALSMTLADLVHADSRLACEACKQAALAGEVASAPIILKLRLAHGGGVEVEALTFAFDYETRPAVLAVLRDLTARRAMEQVTERFRVALDSSPDAVCLIDHESMLFVDVNTTACTSLGYTREELLRMGPQDIKPRFNKRMLREHFAAVFAGVPGTDVVQTLHQRKDGGTFPVEIRIRPFESAGQSLIVAVARDISEQVRAEAELRETNARFRQLAENVDEAFWIRDLVENRFLYVNPAYEKLYGKQVDSLYRHPRSFLASVHPDDRDRVAAAHDSQFTHPSGLNLEYRVIVAGRVRWMWVRTFPIRDADGKVYRTVGLAKEVTERRESEEQYRDIIQTSMDGFWVANAQGRLLDCNDATCRITGYERDELLTLSIPDLEANETPEQAAEHIHRIIEQGSDRFETRLRNKSGQVMDIDISTYYRADAVGGSFFVFLRDITERKQAERALRESEARFATIFQAAPVGISLTRRRDGYIIDFNAAMLDIVGCGRDELLGRTTLELGVWAQPEQRAEMLERLHRQGRLYNQELQFRRMSGDMGDGLMSMEPIELDGEPHLVTLLLDISERKRIEEALRNSEMRFRLLFEHSPIGIAMTDMDGRFIQANQAFCDMLGYSEAELLRKTFMGITHPEDITANLGLFHQAREGDLSRYQMIKRYLHREGHVLWVNLTSSLIRDQFGKPLYSLGMIENVTERVNAEQQRLAHEARQRDALVREVHHRIKNNLQGVINLLRQDIAAHPDTQTPIEAAIAQINTIAVVHGLQSRMPKNEMRLRELLREVNGAVAALAMMALPPRVEDTLSGDVWLDSNAAVSIALILNELIHNALKHGQHSDGSGVEISMSGDSRQAAIRIVNPGAPLPTGFDLASGKGCGTGLDLIRTLLPRRGATLTIRDNGGRIEAEFELSPPLTTDPELPRQP